MFCKSTLVAVALALVAVASPLEPLEPFKSPTGIRIPLRKRNALKGENGVFNFDAAAREVIKLKAKHARNIQNIQNNVGGSPFARGQTIKRDTPPSGNSSNATSSVPLTDQGDDSLWSGNITIGNPAQNFTIDFDTGSADLWVPSSSCSDCGDQHNKYDPSQSSSSQARNGTFEITYGDGSTSSGTPYTDTVTVGNITVNNQFFAAVTKESSEFQSEPIDGLMGMGLTALSSLGEPPFFETAVMDKVVANGSFAFKLSQNGSELFLGGTNQNLYTGDVEYHDVVSNAGYWVIGDASAEVNEEVAVSDLLTIIDSGTTLIVAPPESAQQFYKAIEGAASLEEGYFTFPCDAAPTVSFNWGGNSWKISANDFNLGLVEEGSSDCVGAILGEDLGFGDEEVVWLVGDTFMKNVYTVFSVDNKTVGFAELV